MQSGDLECSVHGKMGYTGFFKKGMGVGGISTCYQCSIFPFPFGHDRFVG